MSAVCPEDCLLCSGEACNMCGPAECEHNAAERHEQPESAPLTSEERQELEDCIRGFRNVNAALSDRNAALRARAAELEAMEKRVWEWVALTEYRHRDAPCTSRCVRDEAMRLRGILEGEKHD